MKKKYETPALEEVEIKIQDVMNASDDLIEDEDGGIWSPLG